MRKKFKKRACLVAYAVDHCDNMHMQYNLSELEP